MAARKSREKRIEGITGLKERKRYLEVQKKKVLEDIAKKNRENDNMRRALDKLSKLIQLGKTFRSFPSMMSHTVIVYSSLLKIVTFPLPFLPRPNIDVNYIV